MLALRRLRVTHTALLRRANATLQTPTPDSVADVPPPVTTANAQASKPKPAPTPAPAAADTATPTRETSGEAEPSTTQGRRRRRTPIPPKRPDISLTNPRQWNRPLAPGVIPAYDLALDLIKKDSYRLAQEAKEVRKEVQTLDGKVWELGWGTEEASAKEEELEERRKKLRILEVQSQANDPEVRWKVANAMADMSNPAHRHLVEQKWRNDGDLDLLMERLHQMNVIPDVLPDLRPTVDVHVVARTTIKEREATQKVHTTVEPGTFLLPGQTIDPPIVYANVFHADTRLYTMLLVDPDVPDEEIQSFRTYLHWLKPNVPLSATTQSRINLFGDTPYIPPHPQQGTPYHRYVLLLLPQPHLEHLDAELRPLNAEARSKPGVPTSVNLDIPAVTAEERRNFDVRAFVEKWGLNKVPGGGAHMWREVWSKKVSDIYENILKEPEPRFGRPPKEDPYLEYKQRKRYI